MVVGGVYGVKPNMTIPSGASQNGTFLPHHQMQKKCHEAIKGEEKRWKEIQGKEDERGMKKNITSEKT